MQQHRPALSAVAEVVQYFGNLTGNPKPTPVDKPRDDKKKPTKKPR